MTSPPVTAHTVGNVGRGMTSPPLDSTHGQQRRAWHDIFAFGQHTRSDVRRDMPSPPLDNTHSRTTSDVACHHRLWAAQTVERRPAWHAIIALGRQTWSNDVRRGMPSLLLGSTNGRTTSSVACYHCPWTTNTVKQRQALHDITALGQHTRSATSGVA